MNKKEILIIFVLAVLITGLSCLYAVPGKGTIQVGNLKFCGWPMNFMSYWAWTGEIRTFFRKEFSTDLLFWFLVLTSSWWVIKKLRNPM